MSDAIPIKSVKKDYNPNKVVNLTNPFKESFSHDFDGERFTVPGNTTVQYPEPLACHLAHHMAKKELLEPMRDSEIRKRIKDPSQAKALIEDRGVNPDELKKLANTYISQPTNEPEEEVAEAS